MHPGGFAKQWKEHLVCRLKNPLYGLIQASRSWYENIDSFFLHHGFHKSKNDPNLYTMYDEEGQLILISLYVDDMIIIGSTYELIKEIKTEMS